MSSYLTIYVRPDKDVEPIPLVHFTRSSEIYQSFYESINPVYIGLGDTCEYTELTESLVSIVLHQLQSELRIAQTRLSEYEKHVDGHMEIIEEILNQHEYIDDIVYAIHQTEFILDMVKDADYVIEGPKRTILCNID